MRVMLVGRGEEYTVGAFFAHALQTLDVESYCFDMRPFPGPKGFPFLDRVTNRLLKRFVISGPRLNRAVLEIARTFRPDVTLIIKGAMISPATLGALKEDCESRLVNYATDDPFNPNICTRELRASIPLYDLYVSTKRAIMPDLRAAGAPNVVFVPFGFDPAYHYPESFANSDEAKQFSSDVVFIGSGDPDRYPMMEALVLLPDITLHLYGGYWQRHPRLRAFYRGFAVDRSYRLALTGAKIAPGLVRRANRDGHSMRSFETLACGGFMLAERTEEHEEFFREDREVAFFNSTEELVDKTRYYLQHDAQRAEIARAGYQRVTATRNTYRDRLLDILDHVRRLD